MTTRTTGLPTIAPYPMPSAADLPANRVSWSPDPGRAVLLVHDMQHYFLRAFTPGASPVTELIDHIGQLAAVCRRLGVPVVYSAQPGGQNAEQRGLQLDMWGRGVGADPDDEAIVAALAPQPGDTRLTKWRYTAFHRTDLQDLLTTTGRDQLIVTGIYAHIGCLMTATDAFMRDIQAFVVADAVADFSRADHDMALRYAAGRAAVVMATSSLLSALLSTADDPGDRMADETTGSALNAERLRADVAELLGEAPASLDPAENLLDRGLDSIRLMGLVERWAQDGVAITFLELAEEPTLGGWIDLFERKAATR